MVCPKMRSLYTTVYSQAHSQKHDITVAGTNEGKVLVYDVSGVLQREDGSNTATTDRPIGPVCWVQASAHPIYSMEHTPDVLVAGTTGAISGWRWSELADGTVTDHAWNINLDTDHTSFGVPEVNSLAYDSQRNSMWAACGDWKTRAYDLTTGKQTHCFEGHKDYVHQVALSKNSIITCGEDGRVLVWDQRSSNTPRSTIQPWQQEKLARPHLGKFISSVDYAGGEWLVCGGGPSAGVFHLRSGGLITSLPPSDQPVTVTRFTKPGDASSIVTAGADGAYVSVCNLSGQVTAKLPTSARCVYTVKASYDKHTLMTIGGYGNKIDMCLNLSYRDHFVTTDISQE